MGDRLAFSETVSGRSGIHIVSPAGTGRRRLVEGGGINTYPAWSPDGRRIVFTSDRAGNPQLYLPELQRAINRDQGPHSRSGQDGNQWSST